MKPDQIRANSFITIRSSTAIRAFCAVALLACAAFARGATIGASGDTSMPSQTNVYTFGGSHEVNINELVAFDPGSGPWLKDLTPVGGGLASGQRVQITETLANGGSVPWTDWHEQIVSRTTFFDGTTNTGFLFRSDSLSLSANYGSGLVPLSEGSDYTLVSTPYSGPGGSGNDGNWEAISIFLAPGKEIGPGQTLQINKQIFEVFLNEDIWMQDEAARIAEFPTAIPEPASLSLCVLGLSTLLLRRNRAPA